MVEMLTKSGNSPEITLKTVEELRSDVKSPEDKAILDDIEAEAVAAKGIADSRNEDNLRQLSAEEDNGRPDDWKSRPEH